MRRRGTPAWSVDAAEVDALLEDLVAIDVGEDLRYRGAPDRVDRSDLRALSRGSHELVQVRLQERHVGAAAVLDPHRKAACVAEAWDGGWPEAKGDGFVHVARQLPVEPIDDCIGSVLRTGTFRPVLERDEIEPL